MIFSGVNDWVHDVRTVIECDRYLSQDVARGFSIGFVGLLGPLVVGIPGFLYPSTSHPPATRQADQLAVKNLELYPALCGKAFTVHWMPFEAPLAEPVEWPCQLRYYAMHARKFGQVGGQGKSQVVATWLE